MPQLRRAKLWGYIWHYLRTVVAARWLSPLAGPAHDRTQLARAHSPPPDRRGDAAIVHQLLDERHRLARLARCSRRSQAGAPPDPLRHERARAGPGPALQEVGDRGGCRAW